MKTESGKDECAGGHHRRTPPRLSVLGTECVPWSGTPPEMLALVTFGTLHSVSLTNSLALPSLPR